MLRTLRLYYNYLLVRCGFRRALPAYFINYPLEWWHFCYGDQMYAAYAFKHIAIYGQLANYP